LDTSKTFSSSNIRLVLRHPSLAFSFIRGGKPAAYRAVLKELLKGLSKCDDTQIELLLKRSAPSFQLPKNCLPYKSLEFSNIVILYYLVRISKPQEIVETGVWSGKTSWAILQALSDNGRGHLTSIDLGIKESSGSRLPTGQIGGFVPENLRKYWTLEFGDAKELLPRILSKLGAIDMFYHDSEHSYEHMMFEFKIAFAYVKEGGIICSDDVNLNNAWMDFSKLLKHHFEIDNKFGYGYH